MIADASDETIVHTHWEHQAVEARSGLVTLICNPTGHQFKTVCLLQSSQFDMKALKGGVMGQDSVEILLLQNEKFSRLRCGEFLSHNLPFWSDEPLRLQS
jgi:hypothetical protein